MLMERIWFLPSQGKGSDGAIRKARELIRRNRPIYIFIRTNITTS